MCAEVPKRKLREFKPRKDSKLVVAPQVVGVLGYIRHRGGGFTSN